MHWIIQENLYHEEGFYGLLRALERLEIPYSVHKVVPFTSRLIPEPVIPEGTKVMVMGATTMVRIAQERGWMPGAYFNANYNMEIYLESPWAPHMLNNDAHIAPFGDVTKELVANRTEDGQFFIRPVVDTKTFTGVCMGWDDFAKWQHQVCALGHDDGSTLTPEAPVMIARPKVIYAEYRVYVVRGRVVTGSLYKQGNRPYQELLIDEDIKRFVTGQAFSWEPSRAFVMDIARTPDGLKIIEAGCLNAAGYYKADILKVVEAVEDLGGVSPEVQGHGVL